MKDIHNQQCPDSDSRRPSARDRRHFRPTVPLLIIGLLLSAGLLFAGCAADAGRQGTPDARGKRTEADTAPQAPPTADTVHAEAGTTGETQPADPAEAGRADEDALRTYYEALLADLRQELIDERSERYISDHEYKARMDTLEAELIRLRREAAPDTDVPVSDEPEPTHIMERDTQPLRDAETEPLPPEDDPYPTVSFRFGITEGRAVIHEYIGSGRMAAIPPEINGHPVTAVADNAFRDKAVSVVVLPDTVESVGWFAFCGCFSLETITIPASVTSIAYGALDGCPNVTVLCVRDSFADRWAQSFGLRIQYI